MPSNRLANLRAALAAFIREREYCGEFDASVETGAVISRTLAPAHRP